MDDEFNDRSPLRKAVIQVVSLLLIAVTIVLGRAWLRREPPRMRDAGGTSWYYQDGEHAAAVATAFCNNLDGRAAYLDGPYASSNLVTYCCGPPNMTSSACDMPSD